MLKPEVEGAAGVEKSPEPVSPEVDGVEKSKLTGAKPGGGEVQLESLEGGLPWGWLQLKKVPRSAQLTLLTR